MNILYVGDNRDRLNWGCRGTSIALYQLLSEKFTISNKITGDQIARTVSVGKLFPEFSNKLNVDWKRPRPILSNLVILEDKLARKLGKSKDIIEPNLKTSVKDFLKYKNVKSQIESIYQWIEACDAMVVNGEGDMIFTSPPRRKLLFLLTVMEIANSLKKPIFYVNAMISDCPISGRNKDTTEQAVEILEKCQLVGLRDPVSFELVESFSRQINARFIPDALFTWQRYFLESELPKNGDFIIPHPEIDEYFGKLDFSQPFICIGGTSLAPKRFDKAIPAYTHLVESLKKLGKALILVQACTGDEFLREVSRKANVPCVPINVPILMAGAILSNANLFVSGRYHPSIFASLGGTPCIFLGSNSHKMRSLQDVLEYKEPHEFSAFPTERECEEITELAFSLIAEGAKRRQIIKNLAAKRAEEAKAVVHLISPSPMQATF
jgi:polysaccharide pyruvyl transferase WcaK-like protein